jgi:tetratricopeptide (TPR) repeat protein
MKKLVLALSLLLSLNVFAYSEHPCRRHCGAGGEVNLRDADQLLSAGLFLMKHLRTEEAIECLNQAKLISPHYLDVRLALMNCFHDIGDKKSGLKEASAFLRFGEVNQYYKDTFSTYFNKLQRLKTQRSVHGYSFIDI